MLEVSESVEDFLSEFVEMRNLWIEHVVRNLYLVRLMNQNVIRKNDMRYTGQIYSLRNVLCLTIMNPNEQKS